MTKPNYVLGIGLSHDGSSCILKDGKVAVAIEKERLTRIKHDGGNDYATVKYCIDALGITIDDLALVVQCANFEKDEIKVHQYKGKRIFPENYQVPVITISHHLAHAYSAAGTSPYSTCNVLVIDGCGSFFHQCDDLKGAFIPNNVNAEPGLYGEKDSYYHFNGQQLVPLYKDFSIINFLQKPNQVFLPTSNHSIGGLYAMASNYCFGSFDDAGKLMGLAPYGKPNIYHEQLFNLQDDQVMINEAIMHKHFTTPMHFIDHSFKENFQYFANIAYWVQAETERAVSYVFKKRLEFNHNEYISYAGGVALNAVTNTKLLQQNICNNLYIEPAAGDNGLAIGCAYYGWLSVLNKEKVTHNGSTFFGKTYDVMDANSIFAKYEKSIELTVPPNHYNITAQLLQEGKIVAWYQGGSEFGPRALGRRSILADPRSNTVQNHINTNIKFREDFRPFAPAVLHEDKDIYFELGLESPYMIQIDYIKQVWKDKMPGVIHVNGTCRTQTVKDKKEPFYQLLTEWKKVSGISVLLNTSLNCKGMPIVETIEDTIEYFLTCAIDVLVINNYVIYKK